MWHCGILSGIIFGILFGILSGILFGIYSDIYIEVQRCPLGSGGTRLRSSGAHWTREVSGWAPAVPTDIGRWLLMSSGAHWDRQCPLGSRAGKEARRRRRRRRRKARRAILKSNNPHLAGGEKTLCIMYSIWSHCHASLTALSFWTVLACSHIA